MRTPLIGCLVTLAFVACGEQDTNDNRASGEVVDPEVAGDLADIQYDEYIEEQIQQDALLEAQQQGYQEGYDEGYDDGYDEGYTTGYDDGRLDGCEDLGSQLLAQGILDWYRC